jgi:hypothetical protein
MSATLLKVMLKLKVRQVCTFTLVIRLFYWYNKKSLKGLRQLVALKSEYGKAIQLNSSMQICIALKGNKCTRCNGDTDSFLV